MTVEQAIASLVQYGLEKNLIEPCEKIWAANGILSVLRLDALNEAQPVEGAALPEILNTLLDDAASRGVIDGESITQRDILDTALMAVLAPRPSQVIRTFEEKYAASPEQATDWYYQFSRDTNYIRTDRIAKDLHWTTSTEYGELDITINLSKPEKDPKAIALAKSMPQSGYPKCQLCVENEGYAGRMDHPARGNHRMIPMPVCGEQWMLQYSPYVYYNEHCIALNAAHVPMKIDRSCFDKLLDIVTRFPHYFVGSNADLPIVGGSILAHEHFQGGRCLFPMEAAPVEQEVTIPGFEDVKTGIVKWPMSVLRLTGPDKERIAQLAEKILAAWRGYTDEAAFIFAETDGVPQNTITPIARRRGADYEMDLVLRNNITTGEYPLGVYHPHAELHHIKKENIGLIEVMGRAVLPARLKEELALVAELLENGGDLTADERTAKHAEWAEDIRRRHGAFARGESWPVVQKETGLVFATVLEHAGVYKRDEEGRAAFLRFVASLG